MSGKRAVYGVGPDWDAWLALPEEQRPHRTEAVHDCFLMNCGVPDEWPSPPAEQAT